jgi:hypothetical protein
VDAAVTRPVKHVSLVRLRRDLSREECLSRWFGEHSEILCRLPRVREYTVDVFPRPSVEGGWDGVSTLRFESGSDLRSSLGHPEIVDALLRTRAEFLEAVDVMIVEEHRLVLETALRSRAEAHQPDRSDGNVPGPR